MPRVKYVGQRVEGDQVWDDFEDEGGRPYSVPNAMTLSKVGAKPAYDQGQQKLFEQAKAAGDFGRDQAAQGYNQVADELREEYPDENFEPGGEPAFPLEHPTMLGRTMPKLAPSPKWQSLSNKPHPGPAIGPLQHTESPLPKGQIMYQQRPGTLSDVADHERLHGAALTPGEPFDSPRHREYAALSDRDKLMWDQNKIWSHKQNAHKGHPDGATNPNYNIRPDGTAEHKMEAAINELRKKLGI